MSSRQTPSAAATNENNICSAAAPHRTASTQSSVMLPFEPKLDSSPTPFLRIKGLKGKAIILTAAKHNLREILAELQGQQSGIDPNKSALNEILRGGVAASSVASEAQSLMTAAGVATLRKDALRGIEIIFSLPAATSIVPKAFFEDALRWVEDWFAVPILSAVIHNDEAMPHCHVILLPLVNGRMRGSELMGNRSRIIAMQADFHAKVSQRYGLVRRPVPKRLNADIRRQVIETAIAKLYDNSGLSLQVLRVLVERHLDDPSALMVALGMTAPIDKPKITR